MNKINENIWISDQLGATQKPLSELGIEKVITVCQTENHQTDFQFPIDDGEHEFMEFVAAVLTSVEQIRRGNTVLIHCHAGKSRSASVAACTLLETEEITLADAFLEIEEKREINVSPELMDSAKRYETLRGYTHSA